MGLLEGFVDKEMIEAHMPEHGEGTIAAVCGPPGFCKFACRKNLDALGWAQEAQIEF